MRLKSVFSAALAAVCLLFSQEVASAGSFDVKPVKIFFTMKSKAEKVTISNKGDGELTLQLRAYKWSEDQEGKDVYEETSDIILFPKLLKLPKGEERIVRVGTKSPPSAAEKTYRIYVEEIPVARNAANGAEVRFLMRAGLPVFISPVKSEARGKIESASMQKGNFDVRVNNDGNVHFSIQAIDLTGKSREGEEVFSKSFSGWYLLSGASRVYSTPVPQAVCAQIAAMDVEVKTDKLALKGRFAVDKSMCRP